MENAARMNALVEKRTNEHLNKVNGDVIIGGNYIKEASIIETDSFEAADNAFANLKNQSRVKK